jgi:metal-sulfur cluster biosynthetic enzyme
MTSKPAFEYSGPPELEPQIARALARVVDPEMALNIVDLGLVYAVEARADAVKLRLTMTSAACPVAELILDDVVQQLEDLFGTQKKVDCELVWDPPWSPERMSRSARSAMGWD